MSNVINTQTIVPTNPATNVRVDAPAMYNVVLHQKAGAAVGGSYTITIPSPVGCPGKVIEFIQANTNQNGIVTISTGVADMIAGRWLFCTESADLNGGFHLAADNVLFTGTSALGDTIKLVSTGSLWIATCFTAAADGIGFT